MAAAGLVPHTADELKNLVFELEVHWQSPCSNCLHTGDPRTHSARVAGLEQLIIGGWLAPGRMWPFPAPAFLRHLTGEAMPAAAR